MPLFRPRPWLAAALLVLLLALPGRAMFFVPEPVPVERLIRNVGRYVEEHPDDPHGVYLLGRIHYLAFSLETDRLSAFEREDEPLPTLSDHQWHVRREEDRPKPSREQMLAHLRQATGHLYRAVKLSPQEALYHLTLASALEQGMAHAGTVGLPAGDPAAAAPVNEEAKQEAARLVQALGGDEAQAAAALKALRDRLAELAPALPAHVESDHPQTRAHVQALLGEYWRRQALDHYRTAFDLAQARDAKLPRQPLRGIQSLVSFEAGEGYLRLLNAEPAGDEQQAKAQAIREHLQALRQKPPGPITPVVLSFEPHQRLADLLTPERKTAFDLDGDGRVEPRAWVKPTTGLLVWDPTGEGRITSGRQLFGAVTGGCSGPTATPPWTPWTTTATATCAAVSCAAWRCGSTATSMASLKRARWSPQNPWASRPWPPVPPATTATAR